MTRGKKRPEMYVIPYVWNIHDRGKAYKGKKKEGQPYRSGEKH